MKKLLLLVAVVFICNFANAQQKVYCELVGVQKFAKSQVTVGIDFGQEDAMRTSAIGGVASRNKLVDADGKPLSFNSMIDAMNYMGALGWKFEQAYVVTMTTGMGGGQNVYHWLLSKNINADETGMNGIETRGQYKEKSKQKQEQQEKRDRSSQEARKKLPIDDLYN
mgnify:FL=1